MLLSIQFEFDMKRVDKKCGTWPKVVPRDCIFDDFGDLEHREKFRRKLGGP